MQLKSNEPLKLSQMHFPTFETKTGRNKPPN